MTYWKECRELQNTIVKDRRQLHRIPELGLFLPKTKAYVIKRLKDMGMTDIRENTKDDGFAAVIHGKESGKTIALRADMDGLPITENGHADYKSRHEGKMHACGHDAHTAMLLGAACVLQKHREMLNGNVKLLFQAAEEPTEGAELMCAEGRLEDVDAIFGTHIGTILSKEIPAGTLIAVPGAVMASVDRFLIKVKGTGCHGSTPEKGVDPINIASHIIIGLQEIIARELSATHAGVLTVGQIKAGSAYNAIPSEAFIEGTVRALTEEDRQYIMKRIGEVAEKTAETFRGTALYTPLWGAPPVVNDPDMTELAQTCAAEIVGEERVITKLDAPNMGGEDFAYYLERVPGAFLFLSSSNREKGTDKPHHNPDFAIDEDVLWIGAAVFVNIVEKILR